MRIEIDLNELFPEVEDCDCHESYTESVAASLKSEIIYRIKNEVLNGVRDKVESIVRAELKESIDNTLKIHVQSKIDQILSEAKIKGRYSDDEPKTIKEYSIERVEHYASNSDHENLVKRIASEYTETIKDRYDRIFASALLDKMLKADLLKDDRIASLLIEKEDIDK